MTHTEKAIKNAKCPKCGSTDIYVDFIYTRTGNTYTATCLSCEYEEEGNSTLQCLLSFNKE